MLPFSVLQVTFYNSAIITNLWPLLYTTRDLLFVIVTAVLKLTCHNTPPFTIQGNITSRFYARPNHCEFQFNLSFRSLLSLEWPGFLLDSNCRNGMHKKCQMTWYIYRRVHILKSLNKSSFQITTNFLTGYGNLVRFGNTKGGVKVESLKSSLLWR